MLQSILLQLLIIINGLGAASGIVYYNNNVYVVSDDLPLLFQYNLDTNTQNQIAFQSTLDLNQITKKNKLDFESLTLVKDQLYALGSGSKENRNEFHSYNLKTKETKKYDVGNVYAQLRSMFHVSEKDFNIEGFSFYKGKSYLFNRGNGKNQVNGIFIFNGLPHLSNLSSSKFVRIQLPTINNQQTTFSDAIIVKNKIIFTATIEVESDVYNDGEIKESIIGLMDLKTFHIEKFHIIAKNQKIEGITLKDFSKKNYHFLFCEDNDDHGNQAKIYELKLDKNFNILNEKPN